MSGDREDLQEALCRYVTDTLSYTGTMSSFCEKVSQWVDKGKTELGKLKHETNSDSLAAVLKETLGGLEELQGFLDALEKLAVTSLHVFVENQGTRLPGGTSLEHVREVIKVARLICPLFLHFKRDAKAFFLPRLQNLEVLSYQLDEYIMNTEKIAEAFEQSILRDLSLKVNQRTVVNLDVALSEDDIRRMRFQIDQLAKIRLDPHYRLVFLFKKVKLCSHFITEFSKRKPEMLQYLKDLEESAAQLDSMSKGAAISGVVSSSVGAVGGVLSIAGLILAPFTFGTSLGMTIGGVGMSIASGLTGIVTTATEMGVNATQEENAKKAFQGFMEDVQIIQACLEEATSQPDTNLETCGPNVSLAAGEILNSLGNIGNNVWSIVQEAPDANVIRAMRIEMQEANAARIVSTEAAGSVSSLAARSVSRAASEIPEVGQAAFKGTLALSKSARAVSGVLSGVFLAADIAFICKDSIRLHQGTETEVSKFLRPRVELWSSEMKSWQKIHDSLCLGLEKVEKNHATLVSPFYPEAETLTR